MSFCSRCGKSQGGEHLIYHCKGWQKNSKEKVIECDYEVCNTCLKIPWMSDLWTAHYLSVTGVQKLIGLNMVQEVYELL